MGFSTNEGGVSPGLKSGPWSSIRCGTYLIIDRLVRYTPNNQATSGPSPSTSELGCRT